MKPFRRFIFFILALLALATPALAFEIEDLYGKWLEKHSKGGMVTEFTPTTISFYPVDPSGKPLASASAPAAITYRHQGETIGIDFGPGQGGLLVLAQDHDTIMLDFPGVTARRLTRVQP